MQNFTSASDVIKAFKSITLSSNKSNYGPKNEVLQLQLHGALSKDCRKPRREAGSCYTCGEQGHYAMKCNKYKKSKNAYWLLIGLLGIQCY
ncbi:unnamed protein product [Ceratitis capitata]|nr:unnamed protein product [Ceratitis capitata]